MYIGRKQKLKSSFTSQVEAFIVKNGLLVPLTPENTCV